MNSFILLLLTFLVHKDYNFYGFLISNKFDEDITVGIDKKAFPKIESFSFNDCIDDYAMKIFRKDPEEVAVFHLNGKKYFVAVILNADDKKRIFLTKTHLFVTMRKTKQCGRLSIYLTNVSKYYD